MIKKKILIIEDNKSDRILIEKSLDDTLGDGIEKYWASSIYESQRILLDLKIDLIILDLTLEDSSGFDTVLKLHQFVNDIPIIIFTCAEDETLRYKSLSTGVRGYLKKGDKNSCIELAEMIIYIMQQNMVGRCRLAGDCPQNIDSIKINIMNLVTLVDELKNQFEKINLKIIGNGTIGYEKRLEKLEGFRSTILKYWWILFPILASTIVGSFFAFH